jgi:hypothetical protein
LVYCYLYCYLLLLAAIGRDHYFPPSALSVFALGCLYQVVDVVIASAEPTEDLDAITVGMVCIRNLQVLQIFAIVGRFVLLFLTA